MGRPEATHVSRVTHGYGLDNTRASDRRRENLSLYNSELAAERGVDQAACQSSTRVGNALGIRCGQSIRTCLTRLVIPRSSVTRF